MKHPHWLTLAALIALASGPVQASLTGDMNEAEKAGSITREQAAKLKADAAKIDSKEEKARSKNNGKLSEADEKKFATDRNEISEKMQKIASMKPDNTGKNYGDDRKDSPTPQVQSNKKQDLELVKTIRKQLVDSKSLSSNAKNVKVVVINGTVTLRGLVDSTSEKETVVSIAQQRAGSNKVLDKLEVVTK